MIHQILAMLLAPHDRSGSLGLQYSGLDIGLKRSSTHATQIFECFQSPVSLSVIQAADNIFGPNLVRANGRLWILTRYCHVYGNRGAHNLFLWCRTTGRTAQGDAGWTPVQQCAWSGGSTVQSICARGFLSVSCTTVTIDTNVWDYKLFNFVSKSVDSWHCRDRVSSCNIYVVQQDTQYGLNE